MNQTVTQSQIGQSAVIYARVSDVKQTGLDSQETRCREFAKMKGYEVLEVFTDDMTGALANRPGMKAMTKFLRKHRGDEPIVIIDDISRLARGVTAHWELRSLITNAGGQLQSPSIEFGEDSDSIFLENILASAAQHQRQKNAEQVKNRMRSRLLNGYSCFAPPIGYRYEKSREHGKILVRDEPYASILQEALEGFAIGRFEAQVEVKRFLESHPSYPKDFSNGEIRQQRVTQILNRPLYAGMIEKLDWNVPMRQGKHEALISFETYVRIQDRLNKKPYVPVRSDAKEDFPLRGAVCCADCNNSLSGAWSAGKKKKYAYYFCFNKECVSYRKSIPRDQIEGEFASMLERVTPASSLFAATKDILSNVWEQRHAQILVSKKTLKESISKIDKQIKDILDRILNTENQTVITAYEKRIAELETEKFVMQEKLNMKHQPRATLEELFEHALRFLANPQRLWNSGQLIEKRIALKLTFSGHLTYCREKGFRTPPLSSPFKVLEAISGGENQMVHPTEENMNNIFNTLADWNEQLEHLDRLPDSDSMDATLKPFRTK